MATCFLVIFTDFFQIFEMNLFKSSMLKPRFVRKFFPNHYFDQNLKKHLTRHASTTGQNGRQTLVILGTGWGGYSLLKNIDKKQFDAIVISPRNAAVSKHDSGHSGISKYY